MDLAIDASIAAKVPFNEVFSAQVEQLFADAVRLDDRLIAPPLILPEMVNAIRKRARSERLARDDAQHRLDIFLALPIEIEDEPGIARRALELALRHSMGGHDAYYVAFAEARGCDLWVDDGRLLRAATSLPFVRWIGGYTGR